MELVFFIKQMKSKMKNVYIFFLSWNPNAAVSGLPCLAGELLFE